MNFSSSFCRIDLAAIAANFRALGHTSRLMPVVKSDAYGHGLVPVAQSLAQAGACRFAVGIAREGVLLRQHGMDQQVVLLLGCHSYEDWQMAIQYRLTPIVGSVEDIEAAEAACGSEKLTVAVKCDSGMGRLGFIPDEAGAVAELLRRCSHLEPKLAISHLSCADMPEELAYTQAQTAAFEEFYAVLAAAFPRLEHSLGNSAATLDGLPQDVGRPGLAIYGGDPFGRTDAYPLRWAMSVAAPVIHVRALSKGQSISYGRLFTSPRDMRVAVVAAGYATGLCRALSGRIVMLVNGKRVPQVGRICMGMTMLDVTDFPHVRPGDLAWIMGGEGNPGEEPVTPLDLAKLLDTIPYEILCQMGSMNHRLYD